MATSPSSTSTTSRLTMFREARGGVSGGAILTGVVVAFGAMFLLSALVAGVLAALGIEPLSIVEQGATEAADPLAPTAVSVGLGAGLTLVIAQFLAYLWGGYTAGRMSRGAGLANGLLVPLIAVLLAIVIATIAAALGATANLNLPFQVYRFPVEDGLLVDWGVAIGILSLVAMFLGGGVGGVLGTRWHSRLEHGDVEPSTTADTGTNRTSTASA